MPRSAWLVLLVCGGSACGIPQDAPRSGTTTARLIEEARWSVAATPVAFAADGEHWLTGDRYGISVMAGAVPVGRLDGADGMNEVFDVLPERRGVVTRSKFLDGAGRVALDANRFAMLGHGPGHAVDELAVSPDGEVALIVVNRSPSTFDDRMMREGVPITWPMNQRRVVAVDVRAAPQTPTVLIEVEYGDYHVAAGPRWLAVAEGRTVQLWRRDDLAAPPVRVELDGPIGSIVDRLRWSSDGAQLLAVMPIISMTDDDRTAIHRIELAPDPSCEPVHVGSWSVAGRVLAIAPRPGAAELAVATTVGRTVHGAIEVRGLDGTLRAQVGHPEWVTSLGWSSDGAHLLASLPALPLVVRYLAASR